jgi:N4-gp56 family major capsid protein
MALSFIPEIWAAVPLDTLKKSLVYAQESVVNRNYEGEIANQGDTVRIRSFSDPTITAHTKNDTITYEELTDAQRSLVIDQANRFSFMIDDVDAAQGVGGELEQALVQASYKLRDAADQYVAGLYTGAAGANALGTVSVTSADLAYTQLRRLKVKLDEANVPQEGRYVVVPPWYHGLLLENSKFVDASAYASATPIRNGEVGRALGFDILVSNNAPLVTGDDYAVMAGHPIAITYAEQITGVEAMRLESKYGNGVRGLHLFGSKLVRPDAIATVVASIT